MSGCVVPLATVAAIVLLDMPTGTGLVMAILCVINERLGVINKRLSGLERRDA